MSFNSFSSTWGASSNPSWPVEWFLRPVSIKNISCKKNFFIFAIGHSPSTDTIRVSKKLSKRTFPVMFTKTGSSSGWKSRITWEITKPAIFNSGDCSKNHMRSIQNCHSITPIRTTNCGTVFFSLVSFPSYLVSRYKATYGMSDQVTKIFSHTVDKSIFKGRHLNSDVKEYFDCKRTFYIRIIWKKYVSPSVRFLSLTRFVC